MTMTAQNQPTVLSKLYTETVIPGRQAIAPSPAYCDKVLSDYDICKLRAEPTGTGQWVTQWVTPKTELGYGDPVERSVWVPDTVMVYSCKRDYVQVCYPARPGQSATPDIVVVDMKLGWNAGARSEQGIYPMPSDLSVGPGYEFKVPTVVHAVVVGLVRQDKGTAWSEYLVALYFNSLGRSIIVNGVETSEPPQPYNGNDVHELRANSEGVLVIVNGVVVATVPMKLAIDTPLFLDATLYSGTDSVHDARAIGAGVAQADIPGFVSFGYAAGYTLRSEQTEGNMPAIVSAARLGRMYFGQSLSDALPCILAAGGTNDAGGGGGEAVLPALVSLGSDAGGGLKPPPSMLSGQASGLMQGVTSFGAMIRLDVRHDLVQHNQLLPPVVGLGGNDSAPIVAGQFEGFMPALEGFASALEGNHQASMTSSGKANGTLVLESFFLVVIGSTGQVASVFGLEVQPGPEAPPEAVTLLAELHASAQAESGFSVDSALWAYIDSLVQANSELSGANSIEHGSEVLVFNDRTGAISRYTRYGFNSFAKIGGRYFGASNEGVYLLEGNDDDGQLIEAVIKTGKLELGSRQLKSLSAIYLGVASDGALAVRVETGQASYLYRARSSSHDHNQQRVDPGRGLRATHYSFELLNPSGGDFELDSVEAQVVALSRRI